MSEMPFFSCRCGWKIYVPHESPRACKCGRSYLRDGRGVVFEVKVS